MEDGNNRVHSEDIMYSKPYMSDAEIHLRYSRGVSSELLGNKFPSFLLQDWW
jgi:hypothetical protein